MMPGTSAGRTMENDPDMRVFDHLPKSLRHICSRTGIDVLKTWKMYLKSGEAETIRFLKRQPKLVERLRSKI